MDSLYTNRVNLHIKRKRDHKKTKLARQGGSFGEWGADIELRGVGASCRVVLF